MLSVPPTTMLKSKPDKEVVAVKIAGINYKTGWLQNAKRGALLPNLNKSSSSIITCKRQAKVILHLNYIKPDFLASLCSCQCPTTDFRSNQRCRFLSKSENIAKCMMVGVRVGLPKKAV